MLFEAALVINPMHVPTLVDLGVVMEARGRMKITTRIRVER